MRRVPELDGVRGIAIVVVLLYHMSPQAMINKLPVTATWKAAATALVYPISNLGWAGVDLFFVLSGFLITGILLETKESASYFQNFYARRVLRIFPIYYLSLLVLLVVLPQFQPALKQTSLYHEQRFFWLYLQNWLETFRAYTGFQSEVLGHTWSLAIEEQFYLFWPLAVFLLRPKPLMRLCVACIAVSLLLRCAANAYASSDFEAYSLVHFSLVTRFDALAFGALIACVERYLPGKVDQWRERRFPDVALGVLCAALVAILLVHPVEPQMENVVFRTIGYTVLAMIFTVLLVKGIADHEGSWWRRLLRNRVLMYCGAISYGLYMYHWPVYYFLLKFMRHGSVKFAFPFAALSLTFVLAYLSFRYLEAPILRLKRHFEGGRPQPIPPLDASKPEGV